MIIWGRFVYENGDLRNYSVIFFNFNGIIKQREYVDILFEEMLFYKLNLGGCFDNYLIYVFIYSMSVVLYIYFYFFNILQVYVIV